MTEIDADRIFEAFAKSLALYYETEKAFMAAPSQDSAVLYIRAVEDYHAIRSAIHQQIRLAISVAGVEQDESVGR